MSRYLLFFVALLFFGSSVALAQRIKVIEGEYIYAVPDNMSIRQAKHEAILLAKNDALDKEYGTAVSMNTMSIINNGNENFYQEAGTSVKGEWIEDVDAPECILRVANNELFIICKVKGCVREITSASIELKVDILKNGLEERFKSTDFVNGDHVYLQFISPVDGYLAVYLYDNVNDIVDCMLPYKRDQISSVFVEGDHKYVFFSKERPVKDLHTKSYTLKCGNMDEVNTFYVVFSTKMLPKPVLDDATERSALKTLLFEDFNSWLSKLQRVDKNVQVLKIPVSISPK